MDKFINADKLNDKIHSDECLKNLSKMIVKVKTLSGETRTCE